MTFIRLFVFLIIILIIIVENSDLVLEKRITDFLQQQQKNAKFVCDLSDRCSAPATKNYRSQQYTITH